MSKGIFCLAAAVLLAVNVSGNQGVYNAASAAEIGAYDAVNAAVICAYDPVNAAEICAYDPANAPVIGAYDPADTRTIREYDQASPSADYLRALLNFEPWAESVWKDYPLIPHSGFFGDGASAGNGGIRGTCGIALAYAVLVREFPQAPERPARLKRLEAALRYAVETHASGIPSHTAIDGKKWGAVPGAKKTDHKYWQTTLWAGTLGLATALLEKELDPLLVERCKKLIAAEADFLSEIPPVSRYKLNSAGEENAWKTGVPVLAASWMADDPRRGKWLETARLYLANSYSVPADTAGPLKNWVRTQTLFPSFAMENHKFYHPSYQAVAGMSMGDGYLMATLVNPAMSEDIRPFAEHNVLNVWNFIRNIMLDSGEMIYPSGLDWSLHSFEHISYLAYIATHFQQPEARQAERRLARQILLRQQVNGDGRFVGESCPDGFYVEAVLARRISMAFLHHRVSGFPQGDTAGIKAHITHFSDVGLIVQRSEQALVSVSYGAKVTALVYPLGGKTPGQDFFTSPNTNSLIGGMGKAALHSYSQTATGFRAQLHSGKGKMFIESFPEAVVFVEWPETAATDTAALEWYIMAVENHALSGGKRKVTGEGRSENVKERSGAVLPPFYGGWMNVDNWMGIAAFPQGALLYRNADNYNRRGAAEDAIVFRRQGSNKGTPAVIIMLPGKDAAATAAVARSMQWKRSGKGGTLHFRMPDGRRMTMKVPG